MIHVVYGLLFLVLIAALSGVAVLALAYCNRRWPEDPLVPGYAPDAPLVAELADKHRMKRRPPVAVPGPGWREAELPALDPSELNALLEEARGITAAAP